MTTLTAKVNVEISKDIEKLLALEKMKDCKIRVYKGRLIMNFIAGYHSALIVKIPVKSILEILRLDLPSWAVVERVVERKVEVFPKVEKCKRCGKKLSDVDEVFALTRRRRLVGAFCSEECLRGWEALLEEELKEVEE